MVVITRKIDGAVRHITLTNEEIYKAKNEWDVMNVIQNLESTIIYQKKKVPSEQKLREIAERINLELSADETLYQELDEEEYRLVNEAVKELD